jgi:WD40 repeat protein
VYAAAFSPDGRTVVAAGDDQTVWIWETATGKVLHKLRGHTATVRALDFAPDGRKVVTVGDDRTGIVWDTSTGRQTATLTGHEQPLITVSFSADGRLIATGGRDEAKVNIWDATTFALRQSLDIGPAWSVAFAPDAMCLSICSGDGRIRICEPNGNGSWKQTKEVRAHSDVILHLAWATDGRRLATAGFDRVVKLWNVNDWTELATFGPFDESVYCVSFSPDDRRLAATVRNAPLKVWDIERPQETIELFGHTALVTAASFCPDGWRLLSASDDGTVRLWDATQITGHAQLHGHSGKVRTVAFSPRGDLLASGSVEGGDVILWDAATMHPLRLFRSNAGANELAFSPDARYLAAVSGLAPTDGYLTIWDVEENRQTLQMAFDATPLFGIAWAPDGRSLAVQAVDGGLRLVASRDCEILAELPSGGGGAHGSVAFSRDGEWLLAAGGDNAARVWNVQTRSPIYELRGHDGPVVSAVFNAEDTLIATSSNDHTVRLWDAATGQHLRIMTGHSGTPFGLAFISDGTRLASSSADQTVKLWDVATGLEVQSLTGHAHWIRDVAFSPDGQNLATAGYDGTVRIWYASNQGTGSAAAREAAALVRHIAERGGKPGDINLELKSDQTVSEPVRTAALEQAQDYPQFWPAMVEGHRAAERRDWAAAVGAFGRVTELAPNEMMHWYWLAMASLGAEQQETYERACKEMSKRVSRESRHDYIWAFRAWLASVPNEEQLTLLAEHRDAYEAGLTGNSTLWLYLLRMWPALEDPPENWSISGAIGVQPEDWYILSMIWLRKGDKAKAHAAYQTGSSQARAREYRWDNVLFQERLGREAEALLSAEPDAYHSPPEGAITDATSRPDLPPAEPTGESAAVSQE